MTLLELLLKELPKRGGWPEGAVECFVHTGIEDYGYFYDKNGSGGVGDWINTTSVKHVETQSGSVAGCSVTREQYEAAITTQQPAWNGEGLPPVGCECELTPHNTRWGFSGSAPYRGVVVAYSGEDFWFKDSSNVNTVSRTDKVDFRPIRTEAERKREETIEIMRSRVTNYNKTDVIQAIGELYEAIAAGKIPGVEITK